MVVSRASLSRSGGKKKIKTGKPRKGSSLVSPTKKRKKIIADIQSLVNKKKPKTESAKKTVKPVLKTSLKTKMPKLKRKDTKFFEGFFSKKKENKKPIKKETSKIKKKNNSILQGLFSSKKTKADKVKKKGKSSEKSEKKAVKPKEKKSFLSGILKKRSPVTKKLSTAEKPEMPKIYEEMKNPGVLGGSEVDELEKHLERISRKGIPRIKTGITGFDKLLERGIPAGSAVIIEGGPGSGKTIFCLQIAYNLCAEGKKVLYMSFEEPERRLIEHMKAFEWTPMKFIKKGNLLMRRFSALDIARSVEALLSEAKKELLIEVKPMFFPKGYEPDIVLIDSLTSIASAFSGERSRFRIYMEQLFKYLEKENITSFLIRETPTPSHVGRATGREEAVSFLSDGIISLYTILQPHGKRARAIEVIKMRGESFDKKIVKLEIKSKKGIIVYHDQTIRDGDILT